jgi:hypothetical protein
MLEPQTRRLLLDSLHAPDGHRLDFAVGTTYSLDLIALLAAPVAFAFSDWQDRDGRPVLEPLALLKAVRQYADRVCLFCQAGKISVPRAYLPLLASLEDSVVEANAPRGGSFHPKLWFLRYLAEGGSVTYRFLCLSRNMTFDQSWDTMLCLEGSLHDRVNAFAQNHPLGDFVAALPQLSFQDISPLWRERITRLAYELRRVKFEVPPPFQSIAFWPLGVSERPVWPFPDRMDRLLLISPFVDDTFIEDLAGHQAPICAVSRPESLALLGPETIGRLSKVWVLDETAEPEAAEIEEQPTAETSANGPETGEEPASPEIPLVGLHAKLFIADIGWNARVWTGSANATKAAFTHNVEFLVELQGKRKDCGTEATLGTRESPGGRRVRCLADLLCPYEDAAHGKARDEEEDAFQRECDRLAKALAAVAPVARCEALADRDRYVITLVGTGRVGVTMPGGCLLRAWPISLSEGMAQAVDLRLSPWARFESLSVEGLTAFFAFELLSEGERFRHRFVLRIPLEGAPENRRDRILRHLLSDPERVLRFLLLLLTDSGAREFSQWAAAFPEHDGKGGPIQSLFQSTLFESLLRALDRDPERIDQVAQLIEDLCQTPEGKHLLPPRVEEILSPIRQVRQTQREAEAARSRRSTNHRPR